LEKKTKEQGFWDKYRQEKEKNSDVFLNELKPLVSDMFRMKGQIERRGLNYKIQGSSADMSKLATYKFFNWILENDLFDKVLITTMVHDEINIEAPEYLVEIAKDKLIQCMEEAGGVFCKTIPISASYSIGDYWIH